MSSIALTRRNVIPARSDLRIYWRVFFAIAASSSSSLWRKSKINVFGIRIVFDDRRHPAAVGANSVSGSTVSSVPGKCRDTYAASASYTAAVSPSLQTGPRGT